MIVRNCDRCKQGSDRPAQLPMAILHIQFEGIDRKEFSWWLGKTEKIDLCGPCFKDFMEFKD